MRTRLKFFQKGDMGTEDKSRNILASRHLRAFEPGTERGPVVVCAAGPSLLKHIPLLLAFQKKGVRICAIKGVGDVLDSYGVYPNYAVFLDGKPDQLRFLQKPKHYCTYYMGSQCDPVLFEQLKDYDVRTWNGSKISLHSPGDIIITGGSTTGLRAINLMRALGHDTVHVIGLDCCIPDEGATHVYSKNLIGTRMKVRVGDYDFYTTPELAIQHEQFLNQTVFVDPRPNVIVYGHNPISVSYNEIARGERNPDRIFMTAEQEDVPGSFLMEQGPIASEIVRFFDDPNQLRPAVA